MGTLNRYELKSTSRPTVFNIVAHDTVRLLSELQYISFTEFYLLRLSVTLTEGYSIMQDTVLNTKRYIKAARCPQGTIKRVTKIVIIC